MGLLQKGFAPLKRYLPRPVADLLRSSVTAIAAPPLHYFRSGHFRSAFARRAVDRAGGPLPWYTYPCIDFLAGRRFEGCRVLEFGGGQSTLWWSERSAEVIVIDDSPQWAEEIAGAHRPNVAVRVVTSIDMRESLAQTLDRLAEWPGKRFDIVAIDGLTRGWLAPAAIERLAEGGAIICDNANGFSIFEGFVGSDLRRVDFHGAQPGLIDLGVTSIFFRTNCFLFDNAVPIHA
jgi:hypothetical protein